MNKQKIDQLASTLKSAGLCASVYDAKNMAESISSGVASKQADMEKQIHRSLNPGKLDDIFEPLKEEVAPKKETRKVEPENFADQKVFIEKSEEIKSEKVSEKTETKKEVFMNKDSVSEELETEKPLVEVLGSADMSIFDDQKTSESEEQSTQNNEATKNHDTHKLQVTNQNKPQSHEQDLIQSGNQNNLIRGDGLYELDRNLGKERARLTQEEKEATDITKWFNFANRS